jgi:hypothetical protein
MKIRIIGDSISCDQLRSMLRTSAVPIVDSILSWGFTVELVDGGECIVFDSVDCELEALCLRFVSELTDTDIIIRRRGGVNFSDRHMRVEVPQNPHMQNAVEVGILRAVLTISRTKQKPLWRFWNA